MLARDVEYLRPHSGKDGRAGCPSAAAQRCAVPSTVCRTETNGVAGGMCIDPGPAGRRRQTTRVVCVRHATTRGLRKNNINSQISQDLTTSKLKHNCQLTYTFLAQYQCLQ